jgi:hypothetical protein
MVLTSLTQQKGITMRKTALRNALKLIPDAPLKSDNMTKSQRKYKKRVWKSLSRPEKVLLIRIGKKKIAELSRAVTA